MTDMLSSICAKIALIGADISGINQSGVFDPPPANLNTADLPALFVWTGTASHDESVLGENFVDTTRRFYLQVAVIPLGQGDPNTREKRGTMARRPGTDKQPSQSSISSSVASPSA